MTQPARYRLQGTADPTTRKAGAASGTQARPASRARPAPVTRQQVNSARPRPRGAPPGVCARRPPAPACPGALPLVERGSCTRRLRCGGCLSPGRRWLGVWLPLTLGVPWSLSTRSQTCGRSQASAEEEARCAAGISTEAPLPGDTENWGLCLRFRIRNLCHTHQLN